MDTEAGSQPKFVLWQSLGWENSKMENISLVCQSYFEKKIEGNEELFWKFVLQYFIKFHIWLGDKILGNSKSLITVW